jgi:hypothetical protein
LPLAKQNVFENQIFLGKAMNAFKTISTMRTQQLPRLLSLVEKLWSKSHSKMLTGLSRLEHASNESYQAVTSLLGGYPCRQLTNAATHEFRPGNANIGGNDWNCVKNIRGGSPC